MRVDIADHRPDGAAHERDLLTGIESITGGRGNDRLAGNDASNTLNGRGGRDRLIGRGGDDNFSLGGSISCGGGQDTVTTGSRFYGTSARLGFLEPDCETIDPWHFATLPPYPATTTLESVSYHISCPLGGEDDEILECSGALQLRRHAKRHTLLALGGFPLGPWSVQALNAQLTPLGRYLAARRQGVRAEAHFTGGGFPASAHWMIQLKVPSQ